MKDWIALVVCRSLCVRCGNPVRALGGRIRKAGSQLDPWFAFGQVDSILEALTRGSIPAGGRIRKASSQLYFLICKSRRQRIQILLITTTQQLSSPV